MQLSLRELLQIQVGNNLLLKGLLLCICVACGGGAVALEHPAPPLQIERPSIWRTALLKLLCGPGNAVSAIYVSAMETRRQRRQADHAAFCQCCHPAYYRGS